MIRDATRGDIPHIVELGARMAARAQSPVGYDRQSVAILLGDLIDDPDGILLCDEHGMIGGLCHPHVFNNAVKVGAELFWYSEGDTGLELLVACEARAKDLGAQHWIMVCEESMRPKAVGRLYEMRGYRPLERSYIKEL